MLEASLEIDSRTGKMKLSQNLRVGGGKSARDACTQGRPCVPSW